MWNLTNKLIYQTKYRLRERKQTAQVEGQRMGLIEGEERTQCGDWGWGSGEEGIEGINGDGKKKRKNLTAIIKKNYAFSSSCT